MAAAVRVLIFNADESYGATLRATVLAFDGVKIVAEVDEAVLLPQAVDRFACDVVVAHLDPLPESVLPLLGEVAESHPELLVFTISESTDGQLILAAMRHGIREFLTKPIDASVLADAFGKVAAKQAGHGTGGTLITVIGGAGGVGASTIAVNLGVELNDLVPGRVAVVDLDHRFGQVATLLDVEPTYTIADLCESPEQVEQAMVEKALVKHPTGLFVLSRPTHFAQADNITASHCVGVLSTLLGMYDFVVVDGPTRFDYGAKSVLDIADYNLLTLQLVVPTVRSVHRMLEGMREVGFNLGRMKLVCNRIGCEGSGISIDDVEATLNLHVYGQVPDDWAAVSSAVNVGEPLMRVSPKSKARLAIRALAQRLCSPEAAAQGLDADRKKGGLLSKIF